VSVALQDERTPIGVTDVATPRCAKKAAELGKAAVSGSAVSLTENPSPCHLLQSGSGGRVARRKGRHPAAPSVSGSARVGTSYRTPAKGAAVDSDRVEGKVKETEGEIQQKWGEATDSESDQTEGKAKETEGEIQQKWGEAKDKTRDAWEDVKDKAEDIGDDAEDRVDERDDELA
jgi:uncharacterized protein YjbJ (UPF0337 family)